MPNIRHYAIAATLTVLSTALQVIANTTSPTPTPGPTPAPTSTPTPGPTPIAVASSGPGWGMFFGATAAIMAFVRCLRWRDRKKAQHQNLKTLLDPLPLLSPNVSLDRSDHLSPIATFTPQQQHTRQQATQSRATVSSAVAGLKALTGQGRPGKPKNP